MQKKYIAPVVFFVALLVLLAHIGARNAVAAKPAFVFAETEKEVFLTFDDGPSTKVTSSILDTLQKENVKATFFLVGARMDGRAETVRRIVREGHAVGIHSDTHIASEIYASDEALLKDIAACEKKLKEVAGVETKLYRFPYGGARKHARAMLEARGYTVIGWNAECGDGIAKNATAESVYETAVKTSAGKNRVVLLMHDAAGHGATAEALPRIIAYFRGQGYAFRAF